MSRRVRVLLILGVALVAAGATTAAALLVESPRPRVATASGTATIGGPFALVATTGQSVTDRTYRGKWLLIYFGYTYCPDACPTALANISVALRTLGPRTNNLQPLFVTVDPQRDTPKVMSDYLKSFDPRIVGLTGTADQIRRVIKEYHLYVSKDKSNGEGANYLVSHSAYVYLMDPRGTFVNVIQGSAGGDEIATWLRKQIKIDERAMQ